MKTRELASRWARTWGTPGLESRVRIAWSDRLTRSLGRALPQRRTVRISVLLRRRPRLLAEVLCHELAHIAAYELRRRREGPHGRTWSALVRAAGHEPSLHVAIAAPRAKRELSLVRWVHRCPVCQFRRIARRPVRRWRCARCVDAGLAGELLVTRRGT